MASSGKFSLFSKVFLAGTILVLGIPMTNAFAATGIQNTVDVKKIAGYTMGEPNEEGGVAEIVKYNSDNEKFYVINGQAQTLDIVSLKDLKSSETVQELQKEDSINIAEALTDKAFTYGDLTSIDINTDYDLIAVAVQEKDHAKSGKIVVLDYDGKIKQEYVAGVQPDMVKITADGKYILSADEAEPRLGLGNADPEGAVTIVEVDSGKSTQVKFDDVNVIADDVHIRNNGTKVDATKDFEPEYIAISKDGKKAYVTLQENNAIATIDITAGKVLSVKSLGYKDHSMSGNELDAIKNGEIGFERLPILGAYMPDAVASVNIGGVEYLVTGNEGDATEWGEDDSEFINVADFEDVKDSITLTKQFKGMTPEEAQTAFKRMKNSEVYDKLEVLTDRGTDAIYTLGGRSFSIWKADTMELVYDSGSDFEKITAERFPDHFNWSNDDDEMDKRSAKKGPEPEDVKVGMIGDKVYAFVGLERIGGVMTYDISNPENTQFANYINSRDFSDKIAGDVAPEGLEFVPQDLSPTGRPLVIVGNEVSGTVSVNEFQVPIQQTPPIDQPDDQTPPVDPNKVSKDLDKSLLNKEGEIILDFSSYSQLSLELTTDKVKEILSTNPNAKVMVNKGDVEVGLPLSILKDINQKVTLNILPKSFEGAIGPVYDFTIQAEDGAFIDKFVDNKITLKFKVDPTKVKDWKSVVIYYIDENGKKAEKIIPTEFDSTNGGVWVEVSHFSTFGVFEESSAGNSDGNKSDNNNSNDSNTDGEQSKKNQSGNQLPDTSTNYFNLIAIGLILVVLGGFMLYIRKRRAV
ncbi:LPXTG cell wall anchor domain-containing protein [Robertmurraya yapensis]|uniref:LPXTG cell wall anchor domain-containing protein n=1 Tax=Bacillus yapensis TaxID=2492960 RepID=A0A3S0KG40_9BACI|nr:choice-of-anchor I family protein [Bacillus yapensis]RTR25956.1 LPXTG cell wall anchor domain-containing protein [Bacillus yapensis]TKS93535.1 LPXTG cell wall anchor domain-containing protein [Bacillus yapensis]